jgi:hypothetical protein
MFDVSVPFTERRFDAPQVAAALSLSVTLAIFNPDLVGAPLQQFCSRRLGAMIDATISSYWQARVTRLSLPVRAEIG